MYVKYYTKRPKEQYYFCYLAILAITVPKFRRALQRKVGQVAERRKEQHQEQQEHTPGEEVVETEAGDVDDEY
jgi:hypothetical protein